MRSSDWSSDVCSSDLQVVGSASLPRHPMTGGGSMIRLQTELLMLTSMLPKHEAELYTLHNDPLVQASIFENILQSHADVKAKLELYLTQWRKNGFGFWMVYEKRSNAPVVIGRAGLRDFGERRDLECGYVFSSDGAGRRAGGRA